MNPKINTILGALLLLSCAFAAGYFVWNFSQFNVVADNLGQYQKFQKGSKEVACTQEVKLCSNGSYVSRFGPDCEFAACDSQENVDCIKEGESIGAVYPGVEPKKCCKGLVSKIPQNIVGTQGICVKEK